MASVTDKLKEKLTGLAPTRLEVVDESHHHIGHAGNPDGKGQTHFTIEIESQAFAGKSRLERHRMVMDAVASVWEGTSLHALSVKARAPGE